MVSFASSVSSATIPQVRSEFQVSANIALLVISLYVLGFAFGPMLWGPASELYGKTRPMWTGYLMFCIFQIPCAVAEDLYVLLAFRFLAGLAGSSILAILGGMFVDFLSLPGERGVSTAIFSLATFGGPVAGPILGNIITEQLGWRWTAWITLIGGAFFGGVAISVTPETSEPVILRWKARKLREETGNANICAKDESEKPGLAIFVQKYLTKPMRMLVREPILIFFTVYMSLAYGIIYVTFTMYPYAFVTVRGWSNIHGSLPFLSIFLGVVIASGLLAIHSIYYVNSRVRQTNQHVPETRLPPMILGSAFLPGGIFLFAAYSDPSISSIPQVTAGVFIGCGSILIFMSGVIYIIETMGDYTYHMWCTQA
ncbi:hypothetical protein IFR05_001650 [Cadophora sp. M221]|nr:hypothetical protein IFR05_001650 [Cadophora sp. M221]